MAKGPPAVINFFRKGVYDDLIRAGTDAEITPVRLTALLSPFALLFLSEGRLPGQRPNNSMVFDR